LMKEMGIPYRRPRRASPTQKRLQELFASGEAEGLTQREIAKRLGVSTGSVSTLVKEMGIPYRRPNPTQKRLQELFASGEAEGLTHTEIGERIGISQSMVSRLMRKMGKMGKMGISRRRKGRR